MTVVCTKVLAQTWGRERAVSMFFDLSLLWANSSLAPTPRLNLKSFSPVLPLIHLAVLHANVWLEGKVELHIIISTVSLRLLTPRG